MKRNILNSPRLLELKKQKQNVLKNKILFSVLGFSIFFVFLAFLSRISKLNISSIVVVGNTVTEAELIKQNVEKYMQGNYMWFFPKTNIFLYSQGKIKNNIIFEFKRLKDIELSVNNQRVLEIKVTEREPKYTWCGASIVSGENSSTQNDCYFLDQEGYIFDKAPYFSGEVYFKFYGEVELKDNIPSGSYFFRKDFSKLISFKKTLENISLKPVMLQVNSDGNVVVYLSSQDESQGPEIKFKLNADINRIVENLETALATEPLKTDFKQKYKSLLYFDLRFGNKVYFKFE